MKTALFIDFDDSFSYNIIQELMELGIKVKAIHWKDFESRPTEDLLVLGPGPGHPDDYQNIYPLVQEWLDQKRPFFGVCLGHQIFWRLQGEEIIRSKTPLHGQKILLNLDKMWRSWLNLSGKVFVQRYNSLCVPAQATLRNPYIENFIQDDEVLISKGSHFITYQFHPESLGTSYRKSFFMPILRVIV